MLTTLSVILAMLKIQQVFTLSDLSHENQLELPCLQSKRLNRIRCDGKACSFCSKVYMMDSHCSFLSKGFLSKGFHKFVIYCFPRHINGDKIDCMLDIKIYKPLHSRTLNGMYVKYFM